MNPLAAVEPVEHALVKRAIGWKFTDLFPPK